jgi:hypothetical protein
MRRSFDGAPNRFEIGGFVVDQRKPCDQSGCRNHAVEPPTGKAICARLGKAMGSPGRCRGNREQSHDLTRHHGHRVVERPYPAQCAEVGDARGLDAFLPAVRSTAIQQAVAARPFEDRDGGNVHLVTGHILADPGPESRASQTFGARIEQERAGRGIDHPLPSACRFQQDSVQNRHLVVGESGERVLVGVENLFTAFQCRLHPQSLGEGFGDHGAQFASHRIPWSLIVAVQATRRDSLSERRRK